MLILTIRTDKPEAEVGLYDDQNQLVYQAWEAHRSLAESINRKVVDVLMAGDCRLHELQGVAVFKGPGSFTGLRIGVSVANGLAYALNVPIVGAMGDEWIANSISRLLQSENQRAVVPEYGALPNITAPKH